jgi:hypothetical protein
MFIDVFGKLFANEAAHAPPPQEERRDVQPQKTDISPSPRPISAIDCSAIFCGLRKGFSFSAAPPGVHPAPMSSIFQSNIARKILIGAGLVTLITAFFLCVEWLGTERGAKRTVTRLLADFEAGDIAPFADRFDPGYTDKNKFTQAEIVEFCTLARQNMSICRVPSTEITAVFDDDKRIAVLRYTLSAHGRLRDENVSFSLRQFFGPTPVTFILKRHSWKPWYWKIASVEAPQAGSLRRHLTTLRTRAADQNNPPRPTSLPAGATETP